MKLRCCFNTVKGGQLITRSITNVHWADIKRKAHLTHREIDIFPYIISGKRNKEISRNINISQKTVSQHRRHIYAKLSVNTLAGLFNILSVNDDITGTDTIKNELKKSIDPSRPQSSPGNSVLWASSCPRIFSERYGYAILIWTFYEPTFSDVNSLQGAGW